MTSSEGLNTFYSGSIAARSGKPLPRARSTTVATLVSATSNGIHAAEPLALRVDRHHDAIGLGRRLVEHVLEDLDDEIHRRVVVVEQQDLEQLRFLRLLLGPFEDLAARLPLGPGHGCSSILRPIAGTASAPDEVAAVELSRGPSAAILCREFCDRARASGHALALHRDAELVGGLHAVGEGVLDQVLGASGFGELLECRSAHAGRRRRFPRGARRTASGRPRALVRDSCSRRAGPPPSPGLDWDRSAVFATCRT